jgi:hypothetical protein
MQLTNHHKPQYKILTLTYPIINLTTPPWSIKPFPHSLTKTSLNNQITPKSLTKILTNLKSHE